MSKADHTIVNTEKLGRTICEIKEKVYMDNDTSQPEVGGNRTVIHRHAELHSGDPANIPPDAYIGKRKMVILNSVCEIPFVISPNQQGQVTVKSVEEAFAIFDEAIKPHLAAATQQYKQQMAQQDAMMRQQRLNNPNHLASPADGPAFQQAAAIAKAAEKTIPHRKGGIVIAGR
jgi:hypothetical protein